MYLPSALPAGQDAQHLAHLELPCPDSAIGLHVRTRTGSIVRVVARPDQLLFQAGQCLEIMSGGHFKATEHFVQGPSAPLNVSRNTFAVFCQPKCVLLRAVAGRARSDASSNGRRGCALPYFDSVLHLLERVTCQSMFCSHWGLCRACTSAHRQCGLERT